MAADNISNSHKLTIGLPIHNEEQSLPQFINALKIAALSLPDDVDIEVVACVNGCDDKSEEILRKYAASPDGEKLNMKVIESGKGKMAAQLAIAKQSTLKGPICFMDADTLPSPDSLKLLWRQMQHDPTCYTTFARVQPYYDKDPSKMSDFEKGLQAYYKSRDYLPPKPYIHGRMFMMRDREALLDMENINWKERADKVEDREIAKSLSLEEGIWADDVYLSRAIAHKHGLKSIREVPLAKVYFHPPEHEADYFAGTRRLLMELKRLELLFPEYNHLEEAFARVKRTDSMSILSRHMSPEEINSLRYYKELEDKYTKAIEKMIAENNYESMAHDDLWTRVDTSKKTFDKLVEQPEFIPFDETTARNYATSVLTVPFTKDGKLVTIKNDRGWDLPGGHLERNEDYTAGAKRESREEANITYSSLKPCGLIKFNDPANPNGCMVVMAGKVNSVGTHKPGDEIFERRISTPEEFLKDYTATSRSTMSSIIAAARQALSTERERADIKLV